MRHFKVLEMANEETLGRSGTEPPRVGIAILIFRNLNRLPVRERLGASSGAKFFGHAGVGKIAVVDFDVLDEVGRDSGKERRGEGRGVRADNVRDQDAAQGAGPHGVGGASVAAAETEEERHIVGVTKSDVRDGDVLDDGAVRRLDGNPLRPFEHAVCDGDIAKAAVRLSAALDAAVTMAACRLLPGPVDQAAELVGPGDEAVGDGHVFRRADVTEGVARLGADGVVGGRIDGAI